MKVLLREISHISDEISMGHCIFAWTVPDADCVSATANLPGFTPLNSIANAYRWDKKVLADAVTECNDKAKVIAVTVVKPTLMLVPKTKGDVGTEALSDCLLTALADAGAKHLHFTHYCFVQHRFPAQEFEAFVEGLVKLDGTSSLTEVTFDVDARQVMPAMTILKKHFSTHHVFPLKRIGGHLFVELNGQRWLLDTGAPRSFGALSRNLCLAGENFRLETSYPRLSVTELSRFVGVECVGILGADVLGHFDHLLDISSGTITISTSQLEHNGLTTHLTDFMGMPILTAQIGGTACWMFFDTGSQISYSQSKALSDFPFAGSVTDFYPGVGQFLTSTYEVPVTLGGVSFTLRCGILPDELCAALKMTYTQGIVGNEILFNRVVGYFPRRKVLILGALN